MTAFGEAFKTARAAGKSTFKWQGKLFHTKTKEEMEKTKKSVPTPTPRPVPNSATRSSSVDAENAGRTAANSPESARSRASSSLAITSAKADANEQVKPVTAKSARAPGKSGFYTTRKVEPWQLLAGKPRRTRAWADK